MRLRCPTADVHSCYLRLSVAQAQNPCQVGCMAWLASSGRTHSRSPSHLATSSQVHLDWTRTGGTSLLGWLSCEYTSALRTSRSFSGSHSPCTLIPLCCSLPLVFGHWRYCAGGMQDTPHILCLLDLGLPMKTWMALGSNGRLSRGQLALASDGRLSRMG